MASRAFFGAFFLLFLLSTVIYRLYLHPLRRYPGPLLWRLTRLPWIISSMRGTLVQDVYAIHKKYGPMVRVAPNELSFANPDAIKPIYQSHPEFPKDPDTLARDSFAVPNIISAPYEDHRRYRRLLSSAFSDRSINDKQDRLLTYVDSLISQLSKTAERGESVDLQTWFNWTTFDIIGDLAFGQPFGCLRDAKTHQWIIDLQAGIRGIAVLNALRRLRLGWLGKMLVAKKMIDGRRRTMRYSLEKIDERLQYGAEPRGDFWDAVLGAKGADLKESAEKGIDVTGAAMTREEMVSNAQALVIAGSETSATLMAGCIWLLLRPKNRECLHKLADEIRRSFRSAEEIVLANFNGLEYLRAVLDESLRVYPPAPLPNNRVVTAKGALISGQFVPPGTSVTFQQYSASRSTNNFHRPHEFLPERWLPGVDPAFAHDQREAFQPFSAGPRNCIGRQLAYAEMRLVVAKLLWHFDLELDYERMGGRDWLADQTAYILWEKGPLWVRLVPRKL